MPNLDLKYFFVSPQSQIVQMAATIAQAQGFKLYAVGGVVRDRLLELLAADRVAGDQSAVAPTFCNDIDLVVEGQAEAGLQVAIALHQQLSQLVTANQLESDYGTARLLTFAQFQTAELFWPDFFGLGSFTLDLATARQETYAQPGANPQVQASTIDRDLYRRDLTINALAVEILPVGNDPFINQDQNIDIVAGQNQQIVIAKQQNSRQPGELIDLFGGYEHLCQKQVYPIRSGSFAEDPRRIFRAVRFAQRFGFTIAPTTRDEIIATTASGQHDHIGGARLRSELNYVVAHRPRLAAEMLRSLDELGALRCIDRTLHIPGDLSWQLRRLRKWLAWFAPEYPIVSGAIELLVAYLPLPDHLHNEQPIEQINQTSQINQTQRSQPLPNLPKALIKQRQQQIERLDLRLTAEQIKRQGKLLQLEQALENLGQEYLGGLNGGDGLLLSPKPQASPKDQEPQDQWQTQPDLSLASQFEIPINANINPNINANKIERLIKPSQVVTTIEAYDPVTMTIAAARLGNIDQAKNSDWSISKNSNENSTSLKTWQLRLLWLYLTRWQYIKSPLSGHDLKELGYSQGRTIGILLHKLRAAQLDGQLNPFDGSSSREAAVKLLAEFDRNN
ncbi:Polynucleotide adenylyltransferase region [Thalassoporum mexicanum PCC 7367]|uniref:CCA tRNA nucleotidyltransferase n=1 Tax=Thalassoporum mexicanum TaxID=3457544 RepID=UPI00029F844C|nr:CCA tRNA nucleotidyltransferase [Pseudanabaena sp. PCC 7367]AFY70215.1 Polynucleotide adenylyltransferase region [Pseudanabaena sp. PCC 7367]